MASDDSLTARNRINQRNFRARRQNYIKELEERIRKYESEGVQATIEIQSAARQVTDQNNKLRNLLTQRFGMSDYEISSYLGFQQTSPLVANQPFPTAFGANTQLPSLAPTPSAGIVSKSQMVSEMSHSYPTPPQQTDPPRALTSSVLDPALSLASLHKFPPTSHDHAPFLGSPSSRHNSDLSTYSTTDIKSHSYGTLGPDSPTDTLSESSNPVTPAEQMQLDHMRATQEQIQLDQFRTAPSQSQSGPVSCCNPAANATKTAGGSRPNDETACEEAARIIASMRGGDGNPDQVMLELGCTSSETQCKVKNLSIFQLMDRG